MKEGFCIRLYFIFLNVSFLENKRVEHARHHFFPLPGQSVDWELGEFLCPLCQSYGNTVLPLIPQVGQLSVRAHLSLPKRRITMREWKEIVSLAVELGDGDAMDTGKFLCVTFEVFRCSKCFSRI